MPTSNQDLAAACYYQLQCPTLSRCIKQRPNGNTSLGQCCTCIRSPMHGAMVSSPAADVSNLDAGLQLCMHLGHVLLNALDQEVSDPSAQRSAYTPSVHAGGRCCPWLQSPSTAMSLPHNTAMQFVPACAADCTPACLIGHVVIAPALASQKAILERRAPDSICCGSDEACTQSNPPSALGLCKRISRQPQDDVVPKLVSPMCRLSMPAYAMR